MSCQTTRASPWNGFHVRKAAIRWMSSALDMCGASVATAGWAGPASVTVCLCPVHMVVNIPLG
eukprot:12886263-Prorocentrum_lima.AAC.1